ARVVAVHPVVAVGPLLALEPQLVPVDALAQPRHLDPVGHDPRDVDVEQGPRGERLGVERADQPGDEPGGHVEVEARLDAEVADRCPSGAITARLTPSTSRSARRSDWRPSASIPSSLVSRTSSIYRPGYSELRRSPPPRRLRRGGADGRSTPGPAPRPDATSP